MSVVQQSHIEPGAGCSVDVGTGSAGRGGSAEAENVSADNDDGAASSLVLPGRNDCSKVSLSIATSIETKYGATITGHQQTTVELSQSVYRSEEVA